MISGIVRSVFSVASLFKDGQQGFWYDPTEIDTLYQDSAGTTPVTLAGEPVGLVIDKSGNTNNATQSISASRPTYNVNPERLTLDKVDDSIIVNIPTGGWIGSMVLATDQGTASYGVNIPAGDYEIGGIHFPGNSINNVLMREGVISASDLARTEAVFVAGGAKASYGGVIDFSSYWRDMSELTSFPLLDTSSVTNFTQAWYNCNSLTSFPLIDTSSVTNFYQTWYGCNSLTSFPLINTSSVTNFDRAWFGCNSLTSFPLIDTSSSTKFYQTWYGCNSLTSFPLLDTSSSTNFNQTWYGCNSLTSFPLIDTSSSTSFDRAWYNCNSLTSFPLLDTSSSTNFYQTWNGCNSLTSFPASFFDNCLATNFTNAFITTNLSQTSIDGILVSINSNNTRNGTFNQSGGSAPSATGEAAITAMRSRGWTVTVTGGF